MDSFTVGLDNAFEGLDKTVAETSYIGSFTFFKKAVVHAPKYIYNALRTRWGLVYEDALSETVQEMSMLDTKMYYSTVPEKTNPVCIPAPRISPPPPVHESMSYESPGLVRVLKDELPLTGFVTSPTLDVSSYDCRSPESGSLSSWLPTAPSLTNVNIFDIRWY
jgi:hypothetical protein